MIVLPNFAHPREFAVGGHAGMNGGLYGLLFDRAGSYCSAWITVENVSDYTNTYSYYEDSLRLEIEM